MASCVVVIESECEHGHLDRHRYPEPPPGGYRPGDLDLSSVCPGGGSRRVLDPDEFVDLIDTHTQAIIDGLGIENLVIAPGASVMLDLIGGDS